MPEPNTRAARRAASAERILRAAQEEFGERGLEATTIRRIAERAGVDPSLVIQHHGSKQALFAAAIRAKDRAAGAGAADHLTDVIGRRLSGLPPETRALVRSMLTAPQATDAMREFLQDRVDELARDGDDEDAELRAALAVSSILGLTVARHFLELEPLADVTPEQLERTVRPWLAGALGDD